MKFTTTLVLLGSLSLVAAFPSPDGETDVAHLFGGTVCNGRIGNCKNNGCGGTRQNLRCTKVSRVFSIPRFSCSVKLHM